MIDLILVLALIGFGTWLLVTLVPMAEPFPRLVIAFACFVAFLLILRAFGYDIPVGRGAWR
jgi:hypothetical protein